MQVYNPNVTTAGTATNVNITNDTTTNATVYPTWVSGTSGSQMVEISSTKLTFNPSSGLLSTPAAPVANADLTNKAYVDAFVSGLTPLTACRVATTTALTVTYSNGTAGVGATLTNAGAQAAISIDGVSLSASDRVLIKDQASQFQNGVYTVTTVGSGATNWVLTRATDFNSSSNITEGSFTNITAGSTNAGQVWLETGSGPFVIGTTAIVFNLFGNFGTMATQNANAVAITGGTVNGVVIGGTVPCQIQGYAPTNYQTGTTYTLALTDSGSRVSLTNASAITLTVPASGTVAFPAETEIYVRQGGAGQVTISPAGGVTINSYLSATKIAGQYAYATLKLSSTANTWDLFGNITV
jgi:hypothetical protein